jgi:hypothetical protein
MTDPAIRERAALDLLGRLRDGWRLAPAGHDPGICRWLITARGPHSGRGKAPETLTGIGEDELAAMADLLILLDERRRPEEAAGLERRSRLAYVDGAEAQSREVEGRPLTGEELERVTRRYPEG